MAASVWSGYLTFGLISMPVRLFSAARSTHVQFHMLHRDDHARIKQQLYCPQDERVVARDEIVKGYEYEKGEYVVIEPADIKKIEPKTTKAMEILEFVKASEIDPVYFESSYYLVAEEAGQRPYALLTRALEKSEYVAIAKLSMHNREYTVFLRPMNGGLMLHTMYYEDEVRQMEDFGKTGGIELKDAEVKVAHQLVEALAADFDPKKYHDTFEENVRKLIRARLEGKEVAAVEKPRKPAPAVDIMAALKESLARIPKKPAQRAAEAQRPVEISAPRKSGRKKQGAA